MRPVRVLASGAAALLWLVGSAVAVVLGWRYGWSHGPVPGGCGCFNPAVLLVSTGWGAAGSVGAAAVWSALVAAFGLAVFLMRRPTRSP